MRIRGGAAASILGALALVLVSGPILAGPASAAGPTAVVRHGDTLGGIAARHGTRVAQLVLLNGIRNPDLIQPGQVLLLRPRAPSSSSTTTARSTTTRLHVVRAGENLTVIAARYGARVASIAVANHLANPNHIFVGQRLRIPGVTPAGAAPLTSVGRTVVHVVRAGETLSALARRFGTSVSALVALNHLARPNYIRIGQRLLVSARSTSSPQRAWSTDRFPAAIQATMGRRAVVRDMIVREARRAGVPISLALAVAWQESGWRQEVVSSAGAIGVMQLLPGTAAWVGDAILHARVQVRDAHSNVLAGVALLKHYLERYRGDWRRALAAYYQGQRAVDRYGIFPVSQPYIASVRFLEAMLRP